MDDSKVFPLIIETGWCIGLINTDTNEPAMFVDKVKGGFNGFLTINSMFMEEQEAIKRYKELEKNPYITCEVIELEYRNANGNISYKLKR